MLVTSEKLSHFSPTFFSWISVFHKLIFTVLKGSFVKQKVLIYQINTKTPKYLTVRGSEKTLLESYLLTMFNITI